MLATETDRLNYLSALGITQYRARAPLAGAGPSIALQLTDLATLSALAARAAANNAENNAENSVQASADDQAALVSDAATLAADQHTDSAQQPANTAYRTEIDVEIDTESPPASLRSGTSAAISAINSLAAATRTHSDDNTAHAEPEADVTNVADDANQQAFHCQLALWRQDELFILTDVTQLQASDVQLLKNILTACGRKPQLSSPQQFSWPLAKRRNSAFIDAREHFLGLLDASLANQPIKQLLSFGAQSLRLLTGAHETAELLTQSESVDDALRAQLQQINFAHRWPLTALPSLTQMQQQPARYKPLAWQLLQSRIAL